MVIKNSYAILILVTKWLQNKEERNMKKRFLATLLCVAMAATLIVGCGSSTTTEDTADTSATTEDATTEAEDVADAVEDTVDVSSANVAVFYYTYSDTYIASVRTALDAELDAAGIKYQDYDGGNSQTTQNEQIDTAIQTGATLLVVNIVTSGTDDVSMAIIEKAEAAGIPVIFFNRSVESEDTEGEVLGSYADCAFVGTDAPEAGHLQGTMVGEYVVENFDAIDLNGDGVISYAMFMGQLGNAEAIYRTQYGVEDANAVIEAAGYPALEYFDASNTDCYQVDQDGAWSATAANAYMVTNLSQYNEENGNMIELVICNNDGMAEGVISALNDKGYNLGTDDSTMIPVYGVDATDAAIQLITDGKMTGTVKQDAEGMAEGIAYLVTNAASGLDLMANTDDYNISENVSNKIFIPYAMYLGE